MKLHFSENPGCWERYLQRKYDNPLFDNGINPITQQDVNAAQRKDENERVAFRQAFYALLEQVATLQKREGTDVVLKLKERIDCLYEQCAGLGGNFSLEKQGLRKLNELIMQSIHANNSNNPQTLAKLEKEKASQEAYFNLLEHAFIAHLLRPNSPITEAEIIPTLLTEEEISLKAAMSLFKPEQQLLLCDKARELLIHLKNQGHALPVAWLRLATMEQPIQPLQPV